MSRRPVTLVIHLSSRPAERPELMALLGSAYCPEDEECSVHVTELSDKPGIAVVLRRQKLTDVEHPWIARDHDPIGGTYTYHAVFETESHLEIVASVKRMLEMSGVSLDSPAGSA